MTHLPINHEFELSGTGDEIGAGDLGEATYKVTDTFVDVLDGVLTFTHRVEIWVTDDQMIDIVQHHLAEERENRGDAPLPKLYDQDADPDYHDGGYDDTEEP